ncbi:hypothetical protein D9615_002406 [Tricholomella constricta]|uniref:ATP-NAD kinase n=1 Tax=Tricholomella constricta TaxID=117010 RepID=A0A8H5HN26_9AGAR|nr:hypothetical protein D9615_002406 [Tricholomella constricta]
MAPPLPPSGAYIQSIRDTSRLLRQHAGILIKPESIKRLLLSPTFTTSYKRVSASHGLALPLNFSSPLDELNLLSILSLLNFASGYRVQLHAEVGRGAWDSIRAFVFSLYLSSSTDGDDLLSAKGLAAIDATKVAELLGVNVHVERPHATIPGLIIGELGGPMHELVNLITGALNETGKILVTLGYPNLGAFVAEALKEGAKAKSDADATRDINVILERLVRAIPAFQDMAEVDGQPTSSTHHRESTLRVVWTTLISPKFVQPGPVDTGMAHLLSPDTDTFSTPPTTPGPVMEQIRPSLSRRSSRPTSIHITQGEWTSDIVLEESSPNVSKKQNGALSPPSVPQDPSTTPKSTLIPASLPAAEATRSLQHHPKPMDSPCFVHSQLDKGASLTEWLRNKQHALIGNGDVGVARSLQTTNGHILNGSASPSATPTIDSDEDDHGFRESLTKQLAETAVGVREMSKQLGRARVQSNIQTVLIVTKARDNRLIKLTRELALYLMLKLRKGEQRGLVVYVDNQLRHSRRFDAEGIRREHPELFLPYPRRRTSSSTSVSSLSSVSTTKDESYGRDEGQLRYWTSSMCSHSPHLFDFVVTLGGDGTVLFTSWLFQRIVPPVLPFALGSLGFLTNFDFADHQAVMDSALDSGIRVNLRMRFTCTVYRAVAIEEGKGRKAVKKGETGEIMMRNVEKGGWEALEGGAFSMADGGRCGAKDKEIMCFTTRPVETFEVLNDLVVDRGPSPYVSLLELFGDEHHMTTVQADGLTVSTPTGSTAYSLSAGGSLVHPEIPAILITPICPHTLSFRPMLLPDSMELRICVPYNSRSTAWASFDGRGRVELKQGDHIKVTASKYPFPTVCADKQSTDWFHSISRTLKWNERERQKSFVVVEEESPSKPKKRCRRSAATQEHRKIAPPEAVEESTEEVEEEDEVSDEEEEEDDDDDDAFDIDDSSPEAATMSSSVNALTTQEALLGQEKVNDGILEDVLQRAVAAAALHKHRRRKSKSRSRSRPRSGLRSGVDSPSRFAGPQPHIHPRSPRRVDFDLASSYVNTDEVHPEHQGARDDIHSPRPSSGKSRIPKDRDVDIDNIKTPTALTLPYGRIRHHAARSRSADHPGRRAFAVWGHDESDSNASDSSAGE